MFHVEVKYLGRIMCLVGVFFLRDCLAQELEELVGILLSHGGEFLVSFTDEGFEHTGRNAVLGLYVTLIRGRVGLGITAGEETIGEFVKLAVPAVRRVFYRALLGMISQLLTIACLEFRDVVNSLKDRSHVTAM